MSVYRAIGLLVYISHHMCICLFVCLFVCLSSANCMTGLHKKMHFNGFLERFTFYMFENIYTILGIYTCYISDKVRIFMNALTIRLL